MNIIQNKKRIDSLISLYKNRELSYETTLLLMVLPFIIFIIVFCYLPLLGWAIAFVDYNPGVSIFESSFVGFRYFKDIFSQTSEFANVMVNTFAMSFLGIATSPVPVILAILITEVRNMKYKKIIQTVTSLPNFTSWIIVYAVAFSFFSLDDGLINNLLLKLNIISDPVNVLGDKNIVWYFQTLLGLWKSAGWAAIIYIGAIAGIDQELYEATRVDGAGRLRQILHITIPGILPTFVVLLLLSVGYMLSGTSFEQIYVFRNSLVHEKIQTLDYYVYSVGLRRLNFSFATAMGVFKTVVSIVLLFVTSLISKKLVGSSII